MEEGSSWHPKESQGSKPPGSRRLGGIWTPGTSSESKSLLVCLQFLSWPAPLLQGGCRTGRNTSCLASNLPGAKLLWHPVSRQDGCASTTASWMNEACSFQLISSALGFQWGFYQNKPCVSQTRVGLAIFAKLAYSGQVRCLLRHLKFGSQRLWLLLVFRLCG